MGPRFLTLRFRGGEVGPLSPVTTMLQTTSRSVQGAGALRTHFGLTFVANSSLVSVMLYGRSAEILVNSPRTCHMVAAVRSSILRLVEGSILRNEANRRDMVARAPKVEDSDMENKQRSYLITFTAGAWTQVGWLGGAKCKQRVSHVFQVLK